MKPIVVNVSANPENNSITFDYDEFRKLISDVYESGKVDGKTEALATQFVTRNRKLDSMCEKKDCSSLKVDSYSSSKPEEFLTLYNGCTAREQLNLYRNLYYTDGTSTERGIIASAINEVLSQLSDG